jgi:hypothetical protein
MKRLALQTILALSVGISALAQTQSGSLIGTVTDPNGAVVPGAAVKLVNVATGEERSTTTNDVGDFGFAALVPGTYTLRVEASGFRPVERKGNVVLAAGRLALGNVQLEVGSVSESVTVTSQGQLVATATSNQAAILDSKQVAMISIRGRDPISLLRLLPGVQQGVDQDTFGGSFATPVPVFLGRGAGQTVYVDGVNGGDGGNGGGGGTNFSGATNIDAIAEVNVQMATYTAEHGLKGGSQINFITKRGGQQFHGTGYWYKRHEMFNATNFFNNALGQRKPVYRYSTLGANIGGPVPVPIPVLNPGGKKMFFFYSVDDTQLKDVNQLRTYQMATALERAGNFSETRTTAGALIPVRDPSNLQPFPGNIIPANRINAQGLALLNITPLPNATGTGFNYITQEPSIPHPRRQHLFRFDLRPTDRDTISIKRQTWYTKSVGWEVAGRSSPWGLVRQRYDFTADQGTVTYTRIISPRMVNEFHIGVFHSTENGPPEDDKALAGIQRKTYPALANLPQIAPQNNPLGLIPRVQFGTLQSSRNSGLGQSDVPNITFDGRWPITGADTAFPIRNDLTWNRGVHTFKMGILREHERFGQARSGTFAGEFSFANDGNDPTNAQFAYANAVLGHVTTYTESMGRVPDNFYQSTWAWYIADSWKARRKLTLDIGLRMYRWGYPLWGGGESSTFTFDRFDPAWGGRPPVLYRPALQGTARRAQNPLTGEFLPTPFIGLMVPGTGYSCGPITPKTPCKINGIVTQDDPTYAPNGKRGYYENLPIQFDPRLGIAWDVFGTGKLAIRTGFGVYHRATGGPAIQGGGPAFSFTQTIRYTDINTFFTGVGPTSPVGATGFWKKQKLPVTYNYSFSVQADVGWNSVLDIAYVGTNTHHNLQNWNFNSLPAGIRFRPESRDLTVNPTAASAGALPDVFLRPIPGFGDINIGGPATTERYDSLQVQFNRRFTGGVELAGTYTWAGGTSNGWNQNNPLPSSAARSRNLGVQQHVVNISYVIDIPKGSRVLPFAGSKWILDDWQVSGVTTFANGQLSNVSFTTTDSFDFTGGGESCGMIQTGDAKLPRDQRTLERWFNTSVFLRPTGRGDIGNNCNNAKLRLPGFNNHDLSIFKNFPVREGKYFQFRWEMYNAPNHTQFNAVGTAAQFNPQGVQTQTSFGRVTSARNERRMQFSLRFNF